MKKTILYFSTIFILLSCNNRQKKIPLKKIRIYKDSVSVNIPNNVNPMELYWQFKKTKDTAYLIDTDIPLKHLFTYNLTEKKWKTLNFSSEGPNGIGIGTGFYYHNNDSIFIFSGYQHKLFLFNKNLSKIKEYNLPKSTDVNIYALRKCFLNKKNLFIPYTSFIKKDKNYTNKSHLLLKIDILTNKKTHIVTYPKKMFNKKWNSELLQMSYLIKNDTIYSSFCPLDSLYLYDLQGKLLKKAFAKSKFINTIKPLTTNIDDNSLKAKNKLYRNGFYGGVLYDNEYFYRIAYHLPKKKTIKKVFSRKDLILSVIILNNKLQYLNEIELKKAGGYYHFITKKGLTLSINPNFTKELPEAKRKFYTYKFEQY